MAIRQCHRLVPLCLLLIWCVPALVAGQESQKESSTVAPAKATPRVDLGIVVSDIGKSKMF